MKTTDAGFTLLETLVALMVLGFIVVGLVQGMHFGLSAWDRQARTIDRDGALDTTQRTLRHLIAGMASGSDPRAPAVIGSEDRLAFIAELPQGAPATPIRLADMSIAVDAAHRLRLSWTPHLHARLTTPPPEQTAVLLPGVATLHLAYYRNAANGQEAGWVDQWRSIDPPRLVRVHIAFTDPTQHWPDLIAVPMRVRDDE